MEQLKRKRKWGDRHDGSRIRDLDSFHVFLPYLYPNRTDSEAYFSETFDLTNAYQYIRERNAGEYEYRTTLFQLFIAAFAKTCMIRPQMNRFIDGKRFYMRHDVSIAFIAKREMSDKGDEAMVCMTFRKDDTLFSFQKRLQERLTKARSGDDADTTTNAMNTLARMPRFAVAFVMRIFRFLEYFSIMPSSLISGDPSFTTVFVANLGSIKGKAGYHHLNNWGTNSIFLVLGKAYKKRMYMQETDSYEMRDVIDIGMTVDERISDGFYFIKTIRLIQYLLENPQLLELPLGDEIEFE